MYIIKNDLPKTIEQMIDKANREALKRVGIPEDKFVRRSIRPSDVGKEKWKWIWDETETITIRDNRFLLVSGVYSKDLLQVRVSYDNRDVAILTNYQTLDDFLFIEQYSYIKLTPKYIGASDKPPELCEFSITGITIEPKGMVLCPPETIRRI